MNVDMGWYVVSYRLLDPIDIIIHWFVVSTFALGVWTIAVGIAWLSRRLVGMVR